MPATPNTKHRKSSKNKPTKTTRKNTKSREECERLGLPWKPSRKYLEKALREEEGNKELNIEVFQTIFNHGMFEDFRTSTDLFF